MFGYSGDTQENNLVQHSLSGIKMKILINGQAYECQTNREERKSIAAYLLRSKGIIRAAAVFNKNNIVIDLDKANELINK